ncbi:DUF4352 domain-containing protein [Streptomyces cinereoruber]|uniref:DUF4352 domain-containing protein n=1 Tax=Streptomyces cinereoruber TaxID=67260 RepID=UPI003C2D9C24
MGTGAIIGIVVGGLFGLFILIGILGAALGGGESDKGSDTAPSASAAPEKSSEAAPQKSKAPAPTSEAPKKEPVEDAPVKVTAKRTEFKPSILHDGSSAFTSVTVTVTNSGDKEIDINPLYFTITDTSGGKHTAELGVDEDQIDTVKLAPGENVTGTITGKGKFTPKYVTYVDGLFGDGVRGDVS